ncbi:MAG: hypothetical protein AB1631_01360 [Acidobacteriota bacterium]
MLAHLSARRCGSISRSKELRGAREALAEMERQISRLKPALAELSA